MFGTNANENKTAEKVVYTVKVTSARATKNEHIVMVDLDVNGVKISSCMLKEIVCKTDGEKHKAGDICFVLNFPAEKVGDKYYNRAWFPVSNELMDDILKQTQKKLEAAAANKNL